MLPFLLSQRSDPEGKGGRGNATLSADDVAEGWLVSMAGESMLHIIAPLVIECLLSS